PDGRTAILELKDGEIHEIPAEEGGASKYRRFVFKTHVIHIAGAGGFLERTVRDVRSDREMSASALMKERQRTEENYRRAIETQTSRLERLGIDPNDHRPMGWSDRLAAAWMGLFGQDDALDRILRGRVNLPTEVDMWKIERTALRKRIAELSVE